MTRPLLPSVPFVALRWQAPRTTPFGHRLAAYTGIAAALVLILVETLL